MAVRKAAKSGPSKSKKVQGDVVEDKLVAFAEQLGWLMGTVRAKADGWLDPKALTKEVTRIRDAASELLEHVNREYASGRKAGAQQATAVAAVPPAPPAPRPSRGLVDAPGKRHRKPPVQERIDKRMGEPVGKHVGQKSLKNGMRRGRG